MSLNDNYLKMDMKRAFCTYKWPICTAGVALVFFWGVSSIGRMSEAGVLELIVHAFSNEMLWLAFVPCVLLYGDCLCSDYERKFFQPAILRGGRRKYLLSKLLVCFFSALLVMGLGFLVFVIAVSVGRPLYLTISSPSTYDNLCRSVFGEVLQAGYYPVYFALVGLQYGLLAGVLAVAAMCVSMWQTNRLLVFSVPVFLFYMISRLTFYLPAQFQLVDIFNAVSENCWDNTLLSFGWVILITSVTLACLYLLMDRKMRMWMEHG